MNYNLKYFKEIEKKIDEIYFLLDDILDLIEINDLNVEYTCNEMGEFQDKYSKIENEDTFNKILLSTRTFTDTKYECWEKARELEEKFNIRINKGFTLVYGFLLERYKNYYENDEEAEEKINHLIRETLFLRNQINTLSELDKTVEQLFKN